ncbi:MAG: multidrug effflux MFS transporter [Woeseiaceae bacterium]|nr:multidrug effflux MFS transporter [Woeseiaceae bacterium]
MRAPSVMMLGVASGLSVFGMAIIVPSMHAIALEYDASLATVQFVVSAYLFGLAVAQPASGILCDRFGRRPVMLGGFAVFTVASLLCAAAPSLPLLIFGRFMQAVGVSVGTVTSRAILRDTRDGDQMAEAMSYIAAAMGVAPVLAPIVGGFVDSLVGFRITFYVTAAMGIIVYVAMHMRLGETLSREHVPPGFRALGRNYGVLLRSPQFLGYTLIYGFKQGAFFAFLAVGAPFFLVAYGIDSQVFGILWGLLAVAYVGGATLGAKLTARVGATTVMRFSVICTFACGLLFLGVALAGAPGVHWVLVPMSLLMVFSGSGTPNAMAGAVRHHPTMAGTAAGLSSAIGLVVGGSFTVLSGAIYTGEFRTIGLLIFGATLATLTSWTIARQPLPASAEARQSVRSTDS